MIDGATILITGGTGSFGSRLVRRLLAEHDPKAVRVLSRGEERQRQLGAEVDDSRVRFLLGDVRDRERLTLATRDVDVIIHAAALKQIPACEADPFECVLTNIVGAENVVAAAIANAVPRTISLSSDKACHPVNLYGSCKLVAERIFSQANVYDSIARFASTRWGNVVGSTGSVVPLFEKQAEKRICERCHGDGEIEVNPGYPTPRSGRLVRCDECRGEGGVPGEITITDPDCTRFWMTLDEAVDFVLVSLERMQGGEIFIPKMESKRVVDLAEEIAPSVPQRIIGIRPGEKVHETLITADEARHAQAFEDYYVVYPSFRSWETEYPAGEELPPGFSYTSHQNVNSIRSALSRSG